MDLPPQQRRVLNYLKRQLAKGTTPSLVEIGNYLGCTKQGAAAHLKALQKRGKIKLTRYTHRSIVVLED